jgi:hypothetical protein
MFAQLIFYIRAAQKRGKPIPAFLAVIDRDKAAIMPTEKALPLLDDKNIIRPKSGSRAGRELSVVMPRMRPLGPTTSVAPPVPCPGRSTSII